MPSVPTSSRKVRPKPRKPNRFSRLPFLFSAPALPFLRPGPEPWKNQVMLFKFQVVHFKFQVMLLRTPSSAFSRRPTAAGRVIRRRRTATYIFHHNILFDKTITTTHASTAPAAEPATTRPRRSTAPREVMKARKGRRRTHIFQHKFLFSRKMRADERKKHRITFFGLFHEKRAFSFR